MCFFFRAVAAVVVGGLGRTHATVNSTSNGYIKLHVAPCVSQEFADWFNVSVWIPSDWFFFLLQFLVWVKWHYYFKFWFFSFIADFTIARDGPRGWRLGYIVTLFGQTRSVPMPSSTSFISCSKIDHQNQSADQWYWIASRAGVLWKVSDRVLAGEGKDKR